MMAGAMFHSFHLYLALFLCTTQNKSYLAALSSGGCNKNYLEMREYLLFLAITMVLSGTVISLNSTTQNPSCFGESLLT